jgi:uncharacterized lipoprotein YbaY
MTPAARAWFLTLGFISLIGLGCEKKTGNNNIFESSVSLPASFSDAAGDIWTCNAKQGQNNLTGEVSFNKSINHQRDDILHLSLVKLEGNQASLVNTFCINNITSAPINFTFSYDSNKIDGAAQYILSVSYFIKMPDQVFLQAYQPQGFTEIINNGITDKIAIKLYVP